MFQKIKLWMYRGDTPNWIARLLNRFWQFFHSSGIASDYWVTLEVIGRKSGRIISLPVVLAEVDGQRYLVSMLGKNAQWVLNVQASDGKAYIRSGNRQEVRLEQVPVDQSAPILKNYLQHTPGARPHVPVDKDAPITEFEAISADFPAFKIVSTDTE